MFTHRVVSFPLFLAYFHMNELLVDFNGICNKNRVLCHLYFSGH